MRVIQVALILGIVAASTHIILTALTPLLLTPPRPFVPSLPALALPHPSPGSLLDIPDFYYHQDARGACDPDRLFFVFLVHSRPDHFQQREAIRATWGGLKDIGDGWASATVFMLGEGAGGGGEDEKIYGSTAGSYKESVDKEELEVVAEVEKEVREHGDLVIGSFTDHYHNLTYKHIMTLTWAATYCPHATYIVKADDDAFIDVLGLKARLLRTYNIPPPHLTLACNVLPSRTRPQRDGKWAVSEKDYPWPEYPRYCAGLAYVATPYLARQLVEVANAGVAPRVWVDDVWVTGLLAAALHLSPYYLNLRYSYDHHEMVLWAARARPATAPPYTFVHLDRDSPDWLETLNTLWSHALTVPYNTTTTEPS